MLTSDDRDDFSSHTNGNSSGHIRQPILPREPSALEALTSAIHTISTRVRAPSSPTHPTHRTGRGHPPDLSSVAFPTSPVSPYSPLEEQFAPHAQREYFTRAKERETYGEVGEEGAGREEIVWSGFDRLVLEGESRSRRVLLVAYASGLQIWDTTDTDNATEILNLRDSRFANISSAIVLQTPSPIGGKPDEFRDLRPLVAAVRVQVGLGKLEVVVFSLRTHEIVRTEMFGRRGTPCKGEIKCSDRYVIVATSIPPALHVLSATSLTPILKPITDICSHPTTQLPVFTLGTRLLVYATSRTLDNGMTGIITRQSAGEEAVLSSSGGSAVLELGNAAKKVGGGVLSGVRTLGGMGLAYLSNRGQETGTSIDPDERYRGFSRSAPVPSSFLSNMPSLSSLPYLYSTTEEYRPAPKPSEYGCISVLDLDVRLPSHAFRQIAHFRPSIKPVVLLSLNPSSSLVFSATSEGRTFNMYELRNTPRFGDKEEMPHVWHRYELKRGTTPATVVRAVWSADSRWLAVATLRGTIHLYAISPYCGPPTLDTHGGNKIRNPPNFQPLSCTLQSLVRFHFSRPADAQAPAAGAPIPPTSGGSQLAFAFLPYLASISSRLIPHPQSQSRASPVPTSTPPVQSASRSPQLQPTRIPAPRRPSSSSSVSGVGPDLFVAHFQDMLVFNPADGQMSLQRCILAHSASAVVTTADLTTPSGGSTPIGGRTPSTSFSSQRIPNLSSLLTSTSGRNLDVLVSTGSNAANWNLERDASWPEVKRVLHKPLLPHMSSSAQLGRNAIRTGWLANSEIETFSQSTRILPRSIYQAHQFDFYTLPADYRSKVRNYDLELPGERLEVRQEIQIRPAQRRLSGSSSAGDDAGVVGSFDEPIASAMHTVLDAQPPSPVIPTYPNAASPRSGHWFDAVPIRTVANSLQGGVEGLGRLRREIARPRAARRRPVSEHYDESLRFDDEYDTIFENVDSGDGSHREEDEWEGTEDQDYRQAMDNDRFDDLIVGLMDEEEEERKTLAARLQGSKAKPQGGRRTGRMT